MLDVARKSFARPARTGRSVAACALGAILLPAFLAACAPVPRSAGTLDLSVTFADGRVETQRLSVEDVHLEGCREVQRLLVFAEPGEGNRFWAEILFTEAQADPVRLAYAGALTEGAFASWDQTSPLADRYRSPYGGVEAVSRAQPQPVELAVSVEAPWTAAPDVTRVEIDLSGAFRAEWWLTEFKLATLYCDQVTGAAPE